MYRGSTAFWDADAAAYIRAVEAADGQALELGVCNAYHNFVLACKDASIWSDIKSCCILAGARTLAGALVPVVGDAPTNFADGFVEGDYSRTDGLTGDGSTTYLDSGRANDDDPQDDNHLAVYITDSVSSDEVFAGVLSTSNFCARQLNWRSTNNVRGFANSLSFLQSPVYSGSESLVAVTRANGTQQSLRVAGTTTTGDVDSADLPQENVYIFARNDDDAASIFSDATIAFYSIGTDIDLEALDTAVTNLITAIGNAL
jgi:hypothetical protein